MSSRSTTNKTLSRSESFFGKKPILKKRSISEVMLQRSISSATLMKQAVDALRAQEPTRDRPILPARTYSDFVTTSPMSSMSRTAPESPSPLVSSSSSSGLDTPGEKRHISFNDEVEQCIAINKEVDDHEDFSAIEDEDASDDDGIIMMRTIKGKERKLSHHSITPKGTPKSTPRTSFCNESKTIAMLPSTTLKYRGDTPEPPGPERKEKTSFWSSAPKLAQSPSQETLKPSRSSSNFLLDDEEEEEELGWSQSAAGRRDSVYHHQARYSGYTAEDAEMEKRGLRRTASGMFMPYDEDEDDMVAAGLFGRVGRSVTDSINTVKDIGHVLWTVGWRS